MMDIHWIGVYYNDFTGIRIREDFMKRFLTMLASLGLCLGSTVLAQPLAPSPHGSPDSVVRSVPYQDATGAHRVVLRHTGFLQGRPDPRYPDIIAVSAELRAYDLALGPDGSRREVWRMRDFVLNCTESATLEFSSESPIITDLDRNGYAEVWLVYYTGCRGDVSPENMKILMYEAGVKHAMRGQTFVHVDGMDMGGRFREDAAFANAAPPIRRFAHDLWMRNRDHR